MFLKQYIAGPDVAMKADEKRPVNNIKVTFHFSVIKKIE